MLIIVYLEGGNGEIVHEGNIGEAGQVYGVMLFLEVGLWLPPSPHPIPHAALWVLLYTKYCTLNFLKKRNFRESGRAKGF